MRLTIGMDRYSFYGLRQGPHHALTPRRSAVVQVSQSYGSALRLIGSPTFNQPIKRLCFLAAHPQQRIPHALHPPRHLPALKNPRPPVPCRRPHRPAAKRQVHSLPRPISQASLRHPRIPRHPRLRHRRSARLPWSISQGCRPR